MHFCPDCGQACECQDDIEDMENENAAERCVCDCLDFGEDGDYVTDDDIDDVEEV